MGDRGRIGRRVRNRSGRGFCRRLVEYGVPLTRVAALIDTLHPVLEARTFHWHRKKNETRRSITPDRVRARARRNG